MYSTCSPQFNSSTNNSQEEKNVGATIEKFLTPKDVQYTMFANSIAQGQIRDPNALAIYIHLITMPPNWKVMPQEIANYFEKSIEWARKYIKKLIELKFMFYVQPKNGRFQKGVYLVFNRQMDEEHMTEIKKMFPNTGFPCAEFPSSEKSNNTEYTVKQKKQSVSVTVEKESPDTVCSASHELHKPNGRGEIDSFTKDDYWRYCTRHAKTWSKEEVDAAWNVLAAYNEPVACWQKFLDGTIQKKREKCNSQQNNGIKKSETFNENILDQDTKELPCPKQGNTVRELTPEFKNILAEIERMKLKRCSAS